MAGTGGFTGPTQVNAGTLQLRRLGPTGTATGSFNNSDITVVGGATLGVVMGSGANNSYTAGLTSVVGDGSVLTLQPGSTLALSGDGVVGQFNLQQHSGVTNGLIIDSSLANITRLSFDIGNGATPNGADRINVTRGINVINGAARISVNALAGTTSITPGVHNLLIGSALSFTSGGSLQLANDVIVLNPTTAYNLVLGTNCHDPKSLLGWQRWQCLEQCGQLERRHHRRRCRRGP
jgi:hypothetical protein